MQICMENGPLRPTWDAGLVLQCLLLDTPLLEQQNAKKLCETKNNCAWATRTNSGQMTETKNQQPLLMGTEQKQGAAHALCTRHHRGSGGLPAHLQPATCTRPLHTAPPRGGRTTCPPPPGRLHTSSLSPEGASLPCSTCYQPLPSTAAAGAPVKPCLNFLAGIWSISIELGGQEGLAWRLRGKQSACPAGTTRDGGSIPESGGSLEEEMATYASTLAQKILRTEEPGGLQSMGLQSWHDWATEHPGGQEPRMVALPRVAGALLKTGGGSGILIRRLRWIRLGSNRNVSIKLCSHKKINWCQYVVKSPVCVYSLC